MIKLEDVKSICDEAYSYLESNKENLGDGFVDFPMGACGDSSCILAIKLKDIFDIECEKVSGVLKENRIQTHSWLKFRFQGEELDIDITANQFTGVDKYIFKMNSKWHRDSCEITSTKSFDAIEYEYNEYILPNINQ